MCTSIWQNCIWLIRFWSSYLMDKLNKPSILIKDYLLTNQILHLILQQFGLFDFIVVFCSGTGVLPKWKKLLKPHSQANGLIRFLQKQWKKKKVAARILAKTIKWNKWINKSLALYFTNFTSLMTITLYIDIISRSIFSGTDIIL